MSSRTDVLKSLLRSTARSALSAVKELPIAASVQRAVQDASLSRVVIRDAQLTAAVARVPQVAAATVSVAHDRLRVDVGFEDGRALQMAIRPDGMAFAPGGAKELGFRVDPPAAAQRQGSHEVIWAVAAEIARALWRPALARAPRGGPGGYVSDYDGRLVVDLRSVPEVRWAMRQRIPSILIEAIKPRAIELHDGRLLVTIAIEGLRP
jgi:hypothetical protein